MDNLRLIYDTIPEEGRKRWKKLFQIFWNIYMKTPVLESLFNKVAGFQDCCKTYLLLALLKFSLGKTLKNYTNSSLF